MSTSPTHSLFEHDMGTDTHPETIHAASGRPSLRPINTQTPSHQPIDSSSALSHLNTTHTRESSSSPAQLGGYAHTSLTSDVFVGGFSPQPGILFSAASSTSLSPWAPSSAGGIYHPSLSAFSPGDRQTLNDFNFNFNVECDGDGGGVASADTYGRHRSASLNGGSTESLLESSFLAVNERARWRSPREDDDSDGSNYGSPGPSSPNSAYSSPYHSPRFPPTPDSMAPPIPNSIDISDQSPCLGFDAGIRGLTLSDIPATCSMEVSPTGSSSSALEGISPSQIRDTIFGAAYNHPPSSRHDMPSLANAPSPSPSTASQHQQPAPYHAINRGREESAIQKRRRNQAVFICPWCPNADFTTAMRRQAHIDSHHKGKRYTCDNCHKVYKHATSRDRHCRKEHGETYYQGLSKRRT
ncbi:hypothetical protein CYLTODRAFT_486278 [Cylindrobasidium torrendii FP15055 ss-10]|uniref:C2H2-type domain-containing protein n=1 Tax=Cylindrobasidium torrendii FP15055 ss-10 TaxID=1314674 RepID=A0A0D7BPF5_9AGAR|nr:hypothetical protein CYLTODRAFT_486278 [Cylindrobasidium torrendii FP15055 ss-10]